MHSRLLVSGLPRSLPLLSRSLASPCLPCVMGRQRAAPHSSFPPTTALLQTLHMDIARFQHDLPVLRLHSDRGGEFSFGLLEDVCGAEGIRQTFTLPASRQHNKIAEHRIVLVMEISRTSIVHAVAPHFLWPFAVRYAAEKINLWPRVSHPKTSPTLQWTGEVGDASVFRFYHPGSRRVLSSQDVTFDASVCFYRLHPHRNSRVPLPPLAPIFDPPSPPVAPPPPPPQGPAPSARVARTTGANGGTRGAATVAAAAGSPGGGAGRARAAGSRGAGLGGASAGVPGVGHAGGTGIGGTGATGGSGGADPGGASVGVPRVGRAGGTGTGGTGAAGGTGGAGPVGASAVVLRVGGTGSADTGGATGGTGVGGASRQESLSPEQLCEWAVRWGSPGGGAGGTGYGGAVATGAGSSGGATTQPQQSALRHLLSLLLAATEFPVAGSTPPFLYQPTVQYQQQLLPGSPLPAPAPHTTVTESFTERREPASRPVTPVRSHCDVRPRPPPVPGTHIMALCPSSVPQCAVLPSSPASSLPHVSYRNRPWPQRTPLPLASAATLPAPAAAPVAPLPSPAAAAAAPAVATGTPALLSSFASVTAHAAAGGTPALPSPGAAVTPPLLSPAATAIAPAAALVTPPLLSPAAAATAPATAGRTPALPSPVLTPPLLSPAAAMAPPLLSPSVAAETDLAAAAADAVPSQTAHTPPSPTGGEAAHG
ncbi:unnamed protein product [Closterium sp. NIES-53]